MVILLYGYTNYLAPELHRRGHVLLDQIETPNFFGYETYLMVLLGTIYRRQVTNILNFEVIIIAR